MKNFTPGPWTENDGFICAKFSDGLVHDICDPRCAPPELFSEIEANTRLITSAPELLAALRGIADYAALCKGTDIERVAYLANQTLSKLST